MTCTIGVLHAKKKLGEFSGMIVGCCATQSPEDPSGQKPKQYGLTILNVGESFDSQVNTDRDGCGKKTAKGRKARAKLSKENLRVFKKCLRFVSEKMHKMRTQKSTKNAAVQRDIINGAGVEVFFSRSFFSVVNADHASNKNQQTKGFNAQAEKTGKVNVDIGDHVAKLYSPFVKMKSCDRCAGDNCF